jgi:hypothetical protein
MTLLTLLSFLPIQDLRALKLYIERWLNWRLVYKENSKDIADTC